MKTLIPMSEATATKIEKHLRLALEGGHLGALTQLKYAEGEADRVKALLVLANRDLEAAKSIATEARSAYEELFGEFIPAPTSTQSAMATAQADYQNIQVIGASKQ
jgi:hypothetical protein